jgi:hypothetical protein
MLLIAGLAKADRGFARDFRRDFVRYYGKESLRVQVS